ncbi:hypothetical protein [Actinoplanes lobatus]|uniref:Uncharacterized protein n=1 Tax=Actinoplanes lobatus TaxID=113568 RepID=A0A7W7HFD9_9ACTN|nr:hypothetical protein [Actinoplanes lobatus]MBB4749107.1 hypothetical protein [Actinoplanes lobatus]
MSVVLASWPAYLAWRHSTAASRGHRVLADYDEGYVDGYLCGVSDRLTGADASADNYADGFADGYTHRLSDDA